MEKLEMHHPLCIFYSLDAWGARIVLVENSQKTCTGLGSSTYIEDNWREILLRDY